MLKIDEQNIILVAYIIVVPWLKMVQLQL